MISEIKLREATEEINRVVQLDPPIDVGADVQDIVQDIKKILTLGLIYPTDVFTPPTDELIAIIKDLSEDEVPEIEMAPKSETKDLYSQVGSLMKLRELKALVITHPEFEPLRPDLAEFKDVEALRDKLFERLTEVSVGAEDPEFKKEEIFLEVIKDTPEVVEEAEEVPGAPLDLIINMQFKMACPQLSKEEFEDLEKLILKDGRILQPLLVWNDQIIDGHNRYNIAQKHNLPYEVEEMSFKSEADAIMWIKQHAIAQRNLTDFAKYEMVKDIETYLRSIGELKMKDKKGPKHNTREELAKKAGLSASQIQKAKVVDKEADEETKEKLRKGSVKIGAVKKQIDQSKKAQPEDPHYSKRKAMEALNKWIRKFKSELPLDCTMKAQDLVVMINGLIPNDNVDQI